MEKAISGENFEALAFVVSTALGRKRKPKPVQNWQQAEAAFSAVMGGGAVTAKDFDGKDPTAGLDDAFKKIEEIEKNEQRTN